LAIAEGLLAIKATVDVAKLTTDLLNRPKVDVPEVRAKLFEMLIHAFSAQSALVEAQQEIGDLHQQLDRHSSLEALRLTWKPCLTEASSLDARSMNREVLTHIAPCALGETISNGRYFCAIHKEAIYRTQAYREEEKHRRAQKREDDSGISIIPGPNLG